VRERRSRRGQDLGNVTRRSWKGGSFLRSNLYQLLEGVAIAAYATGATAAYVAVKKAFQQEARGLEGCDSVFKVFCHPHPSASFRPSDWWRRLWRTWQAFERKIEWLRVNFGRRQSRSGEGA
jgi:hypothetical protein